ncbi:unnamed protein product [Merluccius merluccius]
MKESLPWRRNTQQQRRGASGEEDIFTVAAAAPDGDGEEASLCQRLPGQKHEAVVISGGDWRRSLAAGNYARVTSLRGGEFAE